MPHYLRKLFVISSILNDSSGKCVPKLMHRHMRHFRSFAQTFTHMSQRRLRQWLSLNSIKNRIVRFARVLQPNNSFRRSGKWDNSYAGFCFALTDPNGMINWIVIIPDKATPFLASECLLGQKKSPPNQGGPLGLPL